MSAQQRAASTRHKASTRSEQIVMPSRLRLVKDSPVHCLMTVRSSAGVKTTLANVVMVVGTVAISDLHQVQPFLSRPDALQRNSLPENSTYVPSSTMLLSFVGARTQRDNWAMVQPRIALRQLPPHRSVLAIPCPTFQLVTTTSALCLPMVAYVAGEATTTDNLVMEHRRTAPRHHPPTSTLVPATPRLASVLVEVTPVPCSTMAT